MDINVQVAPIFNVYKPPLGKASLRLLALLPTPNISCGTYVYFLPHRQSLKQVALPCPSNLLNCRHLIPVSLFCTRGWVRSMYEYNLVCSSCNWTQAHCSSSVRKAAEPPERVQVWSTLSNRNKVHVNVSQIYI